jgi:outer membrane murein-binding lipoprotein Lpp
MKLLRPLLLFILALCATEAPARAQPTMEQLRVTHEETVRQLQQAQDRKNQLATENEQLKARVGELEGRLNAIDAQARQAEFLRSQFVAWSTFLERYPLLLKRFQSLSQSGTQSTAATPPEPFFDPEWPFSAAGRLEEEPAAAPASAPATQAS